MITLRISPKAESDLIGIWVYSCEKWGADQADNYLDRMETGMKQLTHHPLLGTDYAHVLPGYRRLQVEQHAVFYQVLKAEILVIRVLHLDMDAPARLLD
ncbi:type II toxin-antitoxin system RelE/ParE family toxin [Alkalimonas sp. NCh-2]|uniref:type II toxin-antitoxin system RelE/ParE family toxin n=1 Tax=Alkalimonas sp. NCh-2 TaxID=3144846 RepID=UPI0031F6CF64